MTPPATEYDLDAEALSASRPFVGEWNRLVSQTNWEKGKIIHAWREALREAGAAVTTYSDEAWSRLVGGVSAQHVGRLRRVHERFGEVRGQYEGLYWSHFHAAQDWDDAEMWLEGAVQNGWSVSSMRRQRAETLGEVEASYDDRVLESGDEAPLGLNDSIRAGAPQRVEDPASSAEKSERENEPDAAPFDEPSGVAEQDTRPKEDGEHPAEVAAAPFERLGDLPADLAEVLELFKLAIVRHKADGWSQVAPAHVLALLDGLRHLTLAAE